MSTKTFQAACKALWGVDQDDGEVAFVLEQARHPSAVLASELERDVLAFIAGRYAG